MRRIRFVVAMAAAAVTLLLPFGLTTPAQAEEGGGSDLCRAAERAYTTVTGRQPPFYCTM